MSEKTDRTGTEVQPSGRVVTPGPLPRKTEEPAPEKLLAIEPGQEQNKVKVRKLPAFATSVPTTAEGLPLTELICEVTAEEANDLVTRGIVEIL
jgi:hypothetical protein